MEARGYEEVSGRHYDQLTTVPTRTGQASTSKRFAIMARACFHHNGGIARHNSRRECRSRRSLSVNFAVASGPSKSSSNVGSNVCLRSLGLAASTAADHDIALLLKTEGLCALSRASARPALERVVSCRLEFIVASPPSTRRFHTSSSIFQSLGDMRCRLGSVWSHCVWSTPSLVLLNAGWYTSATNLSAVATGGPDLGWHSRISSGNTPVWYGDDLGMASPSTVMCSVACLSFSPSSSVWTDLGAISSAVTRNLRGRSRDDLRTTTLTACASWSMVGSGGALTGVNRPTLRREGGPGAGGRGRRGEELARAKGKKVAKCIPMNLSFHRAAGLEKPKHQGVVLPYC